MHNVGCGCAEILPSEKRTNFLHIREPHDRFTVVESLFTLIHGQKMLSFGGCPGVPVHEGIPIVFITIHGLMTQFVNVSFFCVPVHEDTTELCVESSENCTI